MFIVCIVDELNSLKLFSIISIFFFSEIYKCCDAKEPVHDDDIVNLEEIVKNGGKQNWIQSIIDNVKVYPTARIDGANDNLFCSNKNIIELFTNLLTTISLWSNIMNEAPNYY